MTAKRISALFFIIGLMLALSGCGRTGKLYLPSDQPPDQSEANSKTSTNYHAQLNQRVTINE